MRNWDFCSESTLLLFFSVENFQILSSRSEQAGPNTHIFSQIAKNFIYDGNSILRIPESFHDSDRFEHSLEIAPRIESWFGIYIAVKELFDGAPVLNFAIIDKLFYNAPLMSLLDYLLLIVDPNTQLDEARKNRKEQLKSGNLTIKENMFPKINELLASLKLKAASVWNPKRSEFAERHLTFIRLSKYNSHEEIIPVPRGRDRNAPIDRVSLFRIYEKNQKYIEFPRLPLVVCKSGNNEYSVPMEFLEVHEKPQRYKNRIDFAMQDKFLKAATRDPHIYKREAIEMLKDLNFSSEPLNFVERFGFSTDPKMITCEGKVLKEPSLVNKENKKINMTPVVRGFQEKALNVVPEKELCCAVFVLRDDEDREPCLEEKEVTRFYKALIDGCEFRSIRVEKNQNSPARSLLQDSQSGNYGFYKNVQLTAGVSNFRACVNDAKAMFERLPDKNNKILLFIVFSKSHWNFYGFVKQFCDVELGVASQHVTSHTAKKALNELSSGKKRIFYQIALKINGKLGGVNQELDWSENAEMTVEEKEKRKNMPLRMYVGIDVTHPTNGSGIDYSIAAIVASMNPGGTSYRNMIVTQEESRPGERPVAHGRERTDILEGKFVQLLKMFAENNDNRIPSQIVVYRDGVSDSEMLRVSHDELRSLKAEVERFLKERGKNEQIPEYTFIVLQKRHKTRFFRKIENERPKDEEAAKRWDEELKASQNTGYVNPTSGTTVASTIVSKYKFDFFLSSHHGALGTSRPGYYTVMHDDQKMTEEEIKKMTYDLSFLSARCRKPISLPTPVHYAHLSCEKAKELYRCFKKNELGTLPRQPRRKDIEDYLQTNIQYPGMSFA
ncbi:hypothetical protein B9Z55_020363 [Caenorhabditis nigoni]|uniref:Piwi domain-containing protein n=1 Tax=Caenorhabditis nigoni TaxID=1611254 RepID=A0A2G5TN50_9PELO|nr:hypothetical protein B9Z55_020363 [Caenorhabditis nigoni]